MRNNNLHSAGSTDKLGTGISEEASNQNSSAPLDNQETVSLKERLAMYQAAVSKKEAASPSNPAVEESEVCSMPGGLASVKKQFESQEMSSSHNTVTQYHYQHKSVQEVSSTEESSTRRTKQKENVPSSQQVSSNKVEKVTHDESKTASFENHYDETVRIRSPSPSYITIESTARQRESPQRAIASPPPLMQRVATHPAPPPRRSETPTSRISRASATPSPPISRAEKLAKLKDTTAKLHQGVSQPQLAPPVLVTEKKSEIIVSPASLHRQLKIGTHVMETTSSNVVSESSVMSGTVKDMREFYEEAVKEDEHKIYSRKGPIDIPQHLGPDAKLKDGLPKVDLSELLHRFETPVEKVYVRKEPIVIAERLGSDNEEEAEKKTLQIEDMPALDVKAIKTVFESGAQSYHVKEEKLKSGKIETGLMSGEKGSKENSPQPIQKEVCQKKSCEPTSCCETKSMKEQFSGVC
ncbi:UNVERIFIED_CONTAM: hypothetical protein FKN15_076788 [Acipenser sinensis]